MRASLIERIESELKKDADDIDGDCIDRGIDELYALDGLAPPKLNDAALDAAARAIRARAVWRRRNALEREARKRRLTRRFIRVAMAACCLAVFSFSANYLSALITGSCLLSKAGVKICCGAQLCVCDMAEETVRHE